MNRLLVAAEAQPVLERIRQLWPECEVCLPSGIQACLARKPVDALLVTLAENPDWLRGSIERWKAAHPALQIVLAFRGCPSIHELVYLMRAGVFDVVDLAAAGPSEEWLAPTLDNLRSRLDEVRRGSLERPRTRESVAFSGLIGQSAEFHNLVARLSQAAHMNSPVLLCGEPGSGKRLAAHAVHALGARNGRPILSLECGSMPAEMLEAELWGPAGQPGRIFAAAFGGTLLLDEIGEMPLPAQARLLQLLETGTAEEPPDVRLVSTTSWPLEPLIESGHFRLELYYRLNVFQIDAPPLRERQADIPALARHFLSRHARQGRGFVLSDEAAAALGRYSWPGNVRELKAAMECAVSRAPSHTISSTDLPRTVLASPDLLEQEDFNLERLEQQVIRRALAASGFDRRKAARLLGIGKTTLYRKLRFDNQPGPPPPRLVM